MAVVKRRTWVVVGSVAVLVVISVLGYLLPRIVAVGTAFYAKQLCSGVFISHRDPVRVVRDDLERYPPWIITWFIGSTVHRDRAAVEAHWLGIGRRIARFQSGQGCALVSALPEQRAARVEPEVKRVPIDALWPVGERVAFTTSPALEALLDNAFVSRQVGETRAIVIVHHGRIVAERYGNGYNANTALPGWSMAKSVVNALAGVMVQQRALALDSALIDVAPESVRGWGEDARRAITVRHALGMTSGLAFQESYGNPLSDAMQMLFASGDTARVAAASPARYEPGSAWAYSSGTTNLFMRALLERQPASGRARFAETSLFEPLGMTSAVIETDAAGTPVGSSFIYATARDWARFGLLYAQDGRWQGTQLLPEAWVRYSRTPAPHSNGRYGAHFWIVDDSALAASVLPADSFHATGHAMQRVTIVPSRDLVVVRLGFNIGHLTWDQTRFVKNVIDVLAPSAR